MGQRYGADAWSRGEVAVNGCCTRIGLGTVDLGWSQRRFVNRVGARSRDEERIQIEGGASDVARNSAQAEGKVVVVLQCAITMIISIITG